MSFVILSFVLYRSRYLRTFKKKATHLRELVEQHFDPVNGWPKDPSVLNMRDVGLLTGGQHSWNLECALRVYV